MLALSIVTFVIAVIAMVFAVAAASATEKLKRVLEGYQNKVWDRMDKDEVGFEALELRIRILERKATTESKPEISQGDTPAFARNLSDGPSGHIFHGHPEHIRPLNPVLSNPVVS